MSTPSIPKPSAEDRLAALQRAIAFQQRGNLVAAEQLYRAILDAEPDQFDALHLLGVIRLQQRRIVVRRFPVPAYYGSLFGWIAIARS